MDPRRNPRTVIDPKIRQVGFFAPPDRSNSAPPDPVQSSSSSPVSGISPSGNSLSPVMIPPPRHSSGPIPFSTVPTSPLRRDSLTVGSYDVSEHILAMSSTTSSSFAGRTYDGEFPDNITASSPGPAGRGNSVKASGTIAASSFPSGGFDLTAVKTSIVRASELTTVSVVNVPPCISGMYIHSPLEY